MKISLQRQVEAGVMYPPGYGFAWMNYTNGHTIAYPVPLNIIVAHLRTWWLCVRFPAHLRDTLHAQGEHAGAFARGYAAGIAKSTNWEGGFLAGQGYGYSKGHEAGLQLGADRGYRRGYDDGAAAQYDAIVKQFSDSRHRQ